jgi:3-hydroxyisobutyrate dehydrogenase-like beta-hydroxyacid dehydrogenase
MNIGFIGVGSMGRAMIPRLVQAGHRVSAWNRNRHSLAELEGVVALNEPAQAFEFEVVISMLADDQAVQQVLLSSNALAHAGERCIHIVMSTLSPALVEQLHTRHDEAGIALIAAPVFGVPAVVTRGQANILAAGPAWAIEKVEPLFNVLGKKTWRLGERPVHACITKIAGNMMITQAIESLGEAIRLAEAYEVSPADFIAILTQTLFDCPSYQRYGSFIASGIHEPGFKLALGLKDVDLALDAASDKGLQLPAARVVRAAMSHAVARGLGDRDWSVFARLEKFASAADTSTQKGNAQ